jgi:hypothetical protein
MVVPDACCLGPECMLLLLRQRRQNTSARVLLRTIKRGTVRMFKHLPLT